MPHAVIISGNAQRFMMTAGGVAGDLRRLLSVSLRGVSCIDGVFTFEVVAKSRLEQAAAQRIAAPLIVAYVGRGSTTGWALDDERELAYTEVAQALLVGTRPIVIVNDTSSAFSLVTALTEAGTSPERVSLLAACGVNLTAHGGFIEEVALAWAESRPPEFPGMIRWGANHDHLFYPQESSRSG